MLLPDLSSEVERGTHKAMDTSRREDLERLLAELRPEDSEHDDVTEEQASRIAATLADLAWEIGMVDAARCRVLSAEALAIATRIDLPLVRAQANRNLAYLHRMLGEFELARDLALKARVDFENLDDPLGLATVDDILSAVQADLGDLDLAHDYALKSLENAWRAGNVRAYAWAHHDIARIQHQLGDGVEATRWLDQAHDLFVGIDYAPGVARCHQLRGAMHTQAGRFEEASTELHTALAAWRRIGVARGQATELLTLARLCQRQGDHAGAIRYGDEGLEIAQQARISDLAAECLLAMAGSHQALGAATFAARLVELALAVARRIRSTPVEIEALTILALIREDLGDLAGALETMKLLSTIERSWYERESLLRAQKSRFGLRVAAAEREARVTERLLHTMLPVPIARELKQKGHVKPALHENATVLFADLVGFTDIAARLSPEHLLEELELIFGAFDQVVRTHGLERLKTIGDAYMAVSGVPVADPDHVIKAARAALGMRDAVRRLAGDDASGGPGWKVRIGLHAGPLVAGMIGRDRTAYDVWGDTVNVASRMESHGMPDRINVSEPVARVLEAQFRLEPRGLQAVKNRGEMPMWFLEGLQRGRRP